MSRFGNIIDANISLIDSSRGTIYLLGDGILDNFYFLSKRDHDLNHEISSLGYKVINYAIEGAQLRDLIHGMAPDKTYLDSRPYSYTLESDGKMYPLNLLTKATKVNKSFTSIYGTISKTEPADTVILSIGGNDLRNSSSANILLGTDYYVNAIMTPEFIGQYENLIGNIKRRCDRMILLSIYSPYMGSGAIYSIYSAVAMPVITKWRKHLERIAKKFNIPIIDLGRMLNNRVREHYGSSDTNLSDMANKCLAKCIEYVNENYNGYGVYYAPDCDFSKLTHEL